MQTEEKSKKDKADKDMLTQFAKMHAEQMDKMTTAFTNMLQAALPAAQPAGGIRRGVCEACIAGNVFRCTHCLKCTGEGHKIADCQLSAADAAAIRAARVAAVRAPGQVPAPGQAPAPGLNPARPAFQPPLNR